MHQTLLSEAALALSRILTKSRLPHGFFGGFAILACGGTHRESKDLDVLVSAPKPTLSALLTPEAGYLEIPQSRDDYVAFFWQPPPALNTSAMVLVEIFTGQNVVARFPLAKNTVNLGRSYVPILTPEFLLRGKLAAAACRFKPGDAQDIQFLVRTYADTLRKAFGGGERKVDAKLVAAAVKRHPRMIKDLEKIGVVGGVRARGLTAAATFRRGAAGAGAAAKKRENVQPGVWGVHRALGWELPSPVAVAAPETQKCAQVW